MGVTFAAKALPEERKAAVETPMIRHLSPASARILRAVIDAIRPRGHGFDQPIEDDVLLEIDRTIPFFPPPLRLGLPLGLRLLEWGPLFFGSGRGRMSRLQRDAARRYFAAWLESRCPPVRMLGLGIRTLVFLAFYQHPTVLAAMDVRWEERIDETRRVRAEFLDAARS